MYYEESEAAKGETNVADERETDPFICYRAADPNDQFRHHFIPDSGYQGRRKMFENANSSVSVLNQTIDQIIGATRKNVDFLASQLDAGNVGPVQGDETETIRTLLDAYKDTHSDVELASVGTDKGVYINSPVTAVNKPGYDPRERPWFKAATENKDVPTVITPYISSNTGNVVASVAQTTGDGHGVVSVSLSLEALPRRLIPRKSEKRIYLYYR